MSARNGGLWRGYRWRESGWTRTRAALSLGMVLGLGAVGTMAAWSDTVEAETGLFSTASVDLLINGVEPEYTFAAVNNVMPGQSRSGMINLQNTGGVDLQYLMDFRVAGMTTAVTTPGYERGNAAALGNHLALDVFAGGTSDGTACSGGAHLSGPLPMSVGGDRAATNDAYRTVDAGTTDSLCVRVTLAPNAPRESRMAQVGVTFTANAETR